MTKREQTASWLKWFHGCHDAFCEFLPASDGCGGGTERASLKKVRNEIERGGVFGCAFAAAADKDARKLVQPIVHEIAFSMNFSAGSESLSGSSALRPGPRLSRHRSSTGQLHRQDVRLILWRVTAALTFYLSAKPTLRHKCNGYVLKGFFESGNSWVYWV